MHEAKSPRSNKSSMERQNEHYGRSVRLLSMRIAESDSWTIRTGGKLSFEFDVLANEAFEKKLSLRLRLFNFNGQPLTVASAYFFTDHMKRGEKARYRAEVDTSCLVPGRYYLCPGLFFSDDNNESFMADEVKDIYSVNLHILNSPGFNHGHQWRSSFGGSVILPDVKTEKLEGSSSAECSGS